MSRKGAKGGTQRRNLRSTETKAGARADQTAKFHMLEKELEARTRELREALEQQASTAAILRAISSSPTDVKPVLDAVVGGAARLCEALDATIFLRDGDVVIPLTHSGPLGAPFGQRQQLTRHWVTGRAVLEARTIHVPDLLESDEFPEGREMAVRYGHRATLVVPLLREGKATGAILVRRREPRPFTDGQIHLLETFADQAEIAIENVRLFDEVQARTEELSESLQQQTATADVLKVISRSTFDLQTVLDVLVESAARLCEASNAFIFQRDGELYRLAANYGSSPEFEAFGKEHPIAPGRGALVGRAALAGETVHIPDVLADPEYTYTEGQKVGGYRTNLGVPLLREGVPIGVFTLMRPIVKPFTEKQIELVTNFAAQAVIAIENTRLLNELRESLQQQTPTADVLKVISRSTFDLQVVLDTLVESAARLCEADSAAIHRPRGDAYPYVASYGYSAEYDQYMRDHPMKPSRGSVLWRTAQQGRIVHVADVQTDPDFADSDLTEQRRIGGAVTVLGVPLLREGMPIGVIILSRFQARPFTDKQIELATTFADQAVIAIENVRLFDEVRARTRDLSEALEQQTATAARYFEFARRIAARV